jgi:2,5-diketo-D-gluconate reductase A
MADHRPSSAASTIPLAGGRAMPVLGLGTWRLTRDTAGTVQAALDLGYRMIDTSGDYGTQPGIGRALRATGVDRDDIYLVTKVEEDEDAYEATRDRLRELGIESVNLMLIHRPPARGAGEELWRGLQRARDAGLTVDIGVSNYTLDQIDVLADATGEMPVVNQIEWTPFGWSEEMLHGCRDREIAIQAYSPLTRAHRLDDRLLADIGAHHGKTPAQVLLRWNLQLGTVPLPKANARAHLEENLQVFDFALTDEDLLRLASRNERWSALGRTLQYV